MVTINQDANSVKCDKCVNNCFVTHLVSPPGDEVRMRRRFFFFFLFTVGHLILAPFFHPTLSLILSMSSIPILRSLFAF